MQLQCRWRLPVISLLRLPFGLLILNQLLPITLRLSRYDFVEFQNLFDRLLLVQLLVSQLLLAHALDVVHQALVLFKLVNEHLGRRSVQVQLIARILGERDEAH